MAVRIPRAGLTLVAVSLISAALFAQARAKPLTNADVIRLAKGGLGDTVVISAINQAVERRFDTSPDALLALKRAGVSDNIIAAMFGTSAPATTPASASASPTRHARQAPGIYIDASGKLVPLEPTVVTRVRSAGKMASLFSAGIASVSLVAELRGNQANQRTTEQQPSFSFYFGDKENSLGNPFVGWLASASSPNEFVLMQMYEKSDHRELVVAKGNAFGQSAGVESENTVPVKIERLSAGAYRVVPAQPLGRGEFCFFYAGGALNESVTAKLFDFGVD